MKKLARMFMVAFALFLLVVPDILEAQRRGGGGGFRGGGGGGFRGGGGGGFRGGGMSARSSARTSVSRPSRASFSGGARAARPNRVDRTPRADLGRVDRTPRADRGDFNRGQFNRGDININRDIDVYNNNGGWWNRGYDGCCDHPVAAVAALGTAAAVGYAAGNVGSYYSTLPYSSCTETIVNGVPYWDCGTGSTWYQPTFYGMDATYLAVTPP
jgi:hypothetical protein